MARKVEKDTRSVWLVTFNGVLKDMVWAESREAALRGRSELDGWAAHITTWRRAHPFITPDQMDVKNGCLEGNGFRLYLDETCHPHPDHKDDDPVEPEEPDVEIQDEEKLLAFCERRRKPLQFKERGGRKHVTVLPERPVTVTEEQRKAVIDAIVAAQITPMKPSEVHALVALDDVQLELFRKACVPAHPSLAANPSTDEELRKFIGGHIICRGTDGTTTRLRS